MIRFRIPHLVLVTVALATAGNARASDLRLGGQAGVNLANASANNSLSQSVNLNTRTGLGIGAFADIALDKMFSFSPEFMYMQKGAGLNATVTDKLDYLEFPLLIKAKFGDDMFKPMLFAGPNLGFRVNAKQDNGSGTSVDISSIVEPIDFGLDFGGGAEYLLEKNGIGLQVTVRYSLGLTNVDKSGVPNVTWRNRGVQILAGVSFPL
jgi:hypothetical protein